MNDRAARLLAAAGIPFPQTAEGKMDATVELSFRTINDADDLKKRDMPAIAPGATLYVE